VVCYDRRSGEIGDYVTVMRQAAEAEERARRAAAAREAAEEQARREAAARAQAEERLHALRKRLRDMGIDPDDVSRGQ
jgi:hypothetical protein